MKRIPFLPSLFLSVLLLQLTACKDQPTKALETTSVEFNKEGELSIYKATTDSLLAELDVEFAESAYETETGLMYRSGMEENQAMLFVFPDVAMHSFYMKNTEFALDIIFVDEHLKVAHIKEDAKPFKETGIPSTVPVKYVLEVNAGLSKKWDLQKGDSIAYKKM